MTTNLTDRFPNAKGYATEKNAERQLAKFAGHIEDEKLLTAVVRRGDGRWLPVVIFGANGHCNIPMLANAGICVTNV